jgi:hypothetical protein
MNLIESQNPWGGELSILLQPGYVVIKEPANGSFTNSRITCDLNKGPREGLTLYIAHQTQRGIMLLIYLWEHSKPRFVTALAAVSLLFYYDANLLSMAG